MTTIAARTVTATLDGADFALTFTDRAAGYEEWDVTVDDAKFIVESYTNKDGAHRYAIHRAEISEFGVYVTLAWSLADLEAVAGYLVGTALGLF